MSFTLYTLLFWPVLFGSVFYLIRTGDTHGATAIALIAHVITRTYKMSKDGE